MRTITLIVLHCSGTRTTQSYTFRRCKEDHLKRGWSLRHANQGAAWIHAGAANAASWSVSVSHYHGTPWPVAGSGWGWTYQPRWVDQAVPRVSCDSWVWRFGTDGLVCRQKRHDGKLIIKPPDCPHAIANFCFGYDKHALHLLIAEKPSLLATLSCHLWWHLTRLTSTAATMINMSCILGALWNHLCWQHSVATFDGTSRAKRRLPQLE